MKKSELIEKRNEAIRQLEKTESKARARDLTKYIKRLNREITKQMFI